MKEQKTPLEILKEVKDAIDFQLLVAGAINGTSVSISKDHAYVCLIAVTKMISSIEKGGVE